MKYPRYWFGRARDHEYLRLAFLTSLAAAFAFGIGSLHPHVSPVVAAITALVSVRPKFHESVQESFRQILGTIVGAGTALTLTYLVNGAYTFILFTAFLVSFGLARVLRLGADGGTVIAVTVVLVTGGNMNIDAVETRFFGVVIGVFVAVLASLFTRRGTPVSRALDATLVHAERLAGILRELGETVQVDAGSQDVTDQFEGWLAETEQIGRDLEVLRVDAEDAVNAARWSPLMRREDAENTLEQVKLTIVVATSVASMVNDLLIVARHEHDLPVPFTETLSEVLGSLSTVVEQQVETAKEFPADVVAVDHAVVNDFTEAASAAVDELRSLDDTMPILIGGSLLQDGEKISQALTGVTEL